MADGGWPFDCRCACCGLSAMRRRLIMTVGILTIVLFIPGSESLKDKRQVVRSILDSARTRFNVSAAEIDHLDAHRRAGVAFACVSNDRAVVNSLLDKIRGFVESNPLCEITEAEMELI